MKNLNIHLSILILVSILVFNSGCAMYEARYSPPVAHVTSVRMNQNNFSIIERNVEGSYAYPSLHFGFYPVASFEIPMGDPRLFSKALADMYSQSKGMVEGNTVQFINWTLDSTSWWLPIPYISPVTKRATFRADLLEFTE